MLQPTKLYNPVEAENKIEVFIAIREALAMAKNYRIKRSKVNYNYWFGRANFLQTLFDVL